jgi:two-component system, NarL family, nitrate/nitrite response regulator NarL
MELMELLNFLLQRLGLRRESEPRYYALDETLQVMLEEIAQQEQRPPEEIASRLLREGLQRRQIEGDLWLRWRSLSAREQEVAALACLGYTNKQIASQLGVSAETVKTHLHHALTKFNLRTRTELGLLLVDWDFSAWDRSS